MTNSENKKPDNIFYRTWVGRDRQVVEITHQEFDDWVDAIIADKDLVKEIIDIEEGRRPYEDLYEGDRVSFPNRVYPWEVYHRISEKLLSKTEGDQGILTTSLLRNIIDTVVGKDA